MDFSKIREMICNLTAEELQILNQDVQGEILDRFQAEEEQALNEVIDKVSEWNEKGIGFYIYNNEDNEIPIYSTEVCVERGWV